jgi:E3 ubiquitin-protein ligase SIAH1
LWQCAEGHLTCAACHASVNDGDGGEDRGPACRRCGERNYRRCHVAAEWLSSIRFACVNAKYGCPTYRPRHAIESHERSCRYAPCFCPLRHCDFPGGPTDDLADHLTEVHGWNVVDFRYGKPFTVRVHSERSVLRAQDDGEIFHLSASYKRNRGVTALSMVCIRPDNAAEADFTYQVKTPPVKGVPQRLQMQATVWASCVARTDADRGVCVTVPDGMFPRDGPDDDSVEVRVDKIAPTPAGNKLIKHG